MFASLRKVDYLIGGADAQRYVSRFINILDTESNNSVDILTSESLFTLYLKSIRYLTSNYLVFFFITYGFIAFSYCYAINYFTKLYKKEIDTSGISFVLLVFPYLKSFCTLRSSFAIAVFLIGLTYIDRNKYLSLVLLVSTFFIHRMSIMYVLIWFFYYAYKNRISKMSKTKYFIFVFAYIIISVLIAQKFQSVIIEKGWLEGTDLYYIKKSINRSLFSRWPMFIAQLLLLCSMTFFKNDKKISDDCNMIDVFCAFDFIMIPASLVFGFWRANEYLYVIRLLQWSYIIPVMTNSENTKQRLMKKMAILLILLLWLIFRIYSEWDDLKIMPYKLFWQ